MTLLIVGLNHVSSPLAVRERLIFSKKQLGDSLVALRDFLHGQELLLLSTCNRTEIYGVVSKEAETAKILLGWLAEIGGFSPEELKCYLYSYQDRAAVRHSFQVASGLDSMIVGETQILGQVKSAVRTAHQVGSLGKVLNRLFQQAFSTAKAVRRETSIGLRSLSLAAIAVRLSRRIFDALSQQKILFIGSNEMIRLCATHFAQQVSGSLAFSNRTLARAQHLSERFSAQAIPFSSLSDSLPQFDIIVSCTASILPILGLGLMERVVRARRHKPMLIIDLAVPRDIESEVGRLNGVYLYTLEDLGKIVERNRECRKESIEMANDIINRSVDKFINWLERRQLSPLIQNLNHFADQLIQRELACAKKQLSKGSSVEAVLEGFGYRLRKNLVRAPIKCLERMSIEEQKSLGNLLHRIASFTDCEDKSG